MSLPTLPAIAVLTPLVTRILGQNPGNFTLQGTNTYLVGSPASKDKVLIDTGEGNAAYAQLLHQYLHITGFRLAGVILTHWHGDHTGGLSSVLKGLNYSPPVYKYPSADHDPEDAKYVALQDGNPLTIAGVELLPLHTPGHTDDHFALWLGAEKALFAGDNVLGHVTPVFSNYEKYLDSLHKMNVPDLQRIYPAHGQLIEDGPAKIKEYIAHRLEREQQVIDTVQTLTMPVDSMDITRKIYGDKTEDILYAANRGVLLYLEKLKNEGRVVEVEQQWGPKL